MNLAVGSRCKTCNTTLSKGQRFCDNCGQRVDYNAARGNLCTGRKDGKPCFNLIQPAIRFCSSCGTENETYMSDKTVTKTGAHIEEIVRIEESDDDEYFSTEEDDFAGPCTSVQIPVRKYSIKCLSSNIESKTDDNKPLDQDEVSKEIVQEGKKNGTHEIGTVGNKTKSNVKEEEDQKKTEKAKTQNTKEVLTEMLKTKGASITSEYIDKLLTQCKTETVKLAVAGRTSAGKSTFINTMRGCHKNDLSFAKSGSGNTTLTVGKYPHPQNDRITFYDLPGYGTKIMPKTKFLEVVDICEFDYFFILFNTSISEDDAWFAQQIQKTLSPFCFVRTMLDQNLSNAERDGMDERSLIEGIRQDFEKSIKEDTNMMKAELFVISNIQSDIGDMSALIDHMTKYLSERKAAAILHFIPTLTQNVIQQKYEELLIRIPAVAFKASLIAAIPVPFLDICLNMFVVNNEVNCYIESFQLSSSEVKDVPGVKDKWLTGKIGQFTFSGLKAIINTGTIYGTVGAIFISEVDSFIPVLGTVAAANHTYEYVKTFLLKTLDEMRKDAYIVYKHNLKTTSNETVQLPEKDLK